MIDWLVDWTFIIDSWLFRLQSATGKNCLFIYLFIIIIISHQKIFYITLKEDSLLPIISNGDLNLYTEDKIYPD